MENIKELLTPTLVAYITTNNTRQYQESKTNCRYTVSSNSSTTTTVLIDTIILPLLLQRKQYSTMTTMLTPPVAVFADAQYLGPSEGTEPEIVIDNVTDAPCFATAMATQVAAPESPAGGIKTTTKTYTVPPPPDTTQMKKRHKRKAIRAGVVGGIVGLLIGGPVGAIILGMGSVHMSKRISKKEEERIWAEYDEKVAQQAAFAIPMELNNVPKARIIRMSTDEISEEISLEQV